MQIEIEHIAKKYKKKQVLRDINLVAETGSPFWPEFSPAMGEVSFVMAWIC